MRRARREDPRDAGTLEESAGNLPSRRPIRSRRRWLYVVAGAVVVVFVLAGLYAFVWSAPGRPAPTPPAPVTVDLGTPTIGTAHCAGNETMWEARVPWLGSSSSVSTAQFSLSVEVLGDGTSIGGENGPAGVSAGSVCVGPALPNGSDWYGVLETSNGTNVATFTYADGWAAVPPATLPLSPVAGASVVVVSAESLANADAALDVVAVSGGPTVSGFSAL